ncbi:MAG: hypothetical protein JOZ16_11335 [Methylobacteriaceae bacterium]|nr:hypothetical protein [Methylobacteriaceae bacterium]
MARKITAFFGLALCALMLAGCDRCGDPVQFNVPGAPKSCYEQTPQK